MELFHPLLQRYAEDYSSPEDELLREINEYTLNNHSEYVMLSGHLQGKLLEMMSRMIKPRHILEIGTFTGYSALCLAKGLSGDGQLHTIELRENDATTAKNFFKRSSYAGQIILHTGNALDIIPTLNESWDLVFIDADKISYIEYFKLVLPQVRQNGFILADNIFFHGEVFGENVNARPNASPTASFRQGSSRRGKNAKAIQAFNEFIRERNDIDKMMITLRDGLYLIRKL